MLLMEEGGDEQREERVKGADLDLEFMKKRKI